MDEKNSLMPCGSRVSVDCDNLAGQGATFFFFFQRSVINELNIIQIDDIVLQYILWSFLCMCFLPP